MQVRRMHNRAAANGAARLFNFDKPDAASADGLAIQVRMRLLGPAQLFVVLRQHRAHSPDTSRNQSLGKIQAPP
jgi:hypothetical protein